jgi:hypothetical protein
VIANWSYGLMRDTSAVLLDMNNPDERTAKNVLYTAHGVDNGLRRSRTVTSLTDGMIAAHWGRGHPLPIRF